MRKDVKIGVAFDGKIYKGRVTNGGIWFATSDDDVTEDVISAVVQHMISTGKEVVEIVNNETGKIDYKLFI